MKKTLKAALKGKLSDKEISLLMRSYDVIGNIAIIEIPKELSEKEELIGKTILEMHRNVKTVAKKIGAHKGIYRAQKVKIIAGEKSKETLYRENNVMLKLDVEKVYFSPRLATERKRIAKLVKNGERVLVMFSGCGPYPFVISKNSKAKEVYGVELNPVAHKYATENIRLNKTENVKLIKGNVRKVVPELKKRFDRIAMPLPKKGEAYLDIALSASKKGTIIHFYDFLREDKIPDLAFNKIKKICGKMRKKFRILNFTKCGQVSPREYRVCVDFKVL